MVKIFHPLLALIASSANNELAKYIQFLKAENKILRSRLPKQIHTTREERSRLLKFGKAIGKAIEELISIVKPSTFYNWVRNEGKPKQPKNSKGGQRKSRDLRELVIEIATRTGFGYTRILGELKRLGIKAICRSTIRNILKEANIEPGPDRTSDTWTDFLNRHKNTLWACDFFSVKTVTEKGLKEMYVLVFLCLTTREAIVSKSTLHPDSAWVCEQTDLFIQQTKNRAKKPTVMIHDRDTKFSKTFVKTLKEHGIKPNALPISSPNLNGRCERFIGTIKAECLNNFLLFGKRHLDYLLEEFTDYYNNHRSHSARENLPPISIPPEEIVSLKVNDVETKQYVGGLVTSFERRAA